MKLKLKLRLNINIFCPQAHAKKVYSPHRIGLCSSPSSRDDADVARITYLNKMTS